MTTYRARGDRIAVAVTFQPLLYQPPPCELGEACPRCVRWLTPAEFAAVDALLCEVVAPPPSPITGLPPDPREVPEVRRAGVCVACGEPVVDPPRGLLPGRPVLRPTCSRACYQRDYRSRVRAAAPPPPVDVPPPESLLPRHAPAHLTAPALRLLAPDDPDRVPYKYAARPGESQGAFAARMRAQQAPAAQAAQEPPPVVEPGEYRPCPECGTEYNDADVAEFGGCPWYACPAKVGPTGA